MIIAATDIHTIIVYMYIYTHTYPIGVMKEAELAMSTAMTKGFWFTLRDLAMASASRTVMAAAALLVRISVTTCRSQCVRPAAPCKSVKHE